MKPLNDLERAILRFEETWGVHAGRKEEAIRVAFDMRAPRYYQTVNRLLDAPAAVAEFPQLIARLQRARQARLASRPVRTDRLTVAR